MEKVVGQKDVTLVRDMFVTPKKYKTVPKLKPTSKCDQLSSDLKKINIWHFFPRNQGKFATKHSFFIFTPKMKPLGHHHTTGLENQ
jgi:hypothetical protein